MFKEQHVWTYQDSKEKQSSNVSSYGSLKYFYHSIWNLSKTRNNNRRIILPLSRYEYPSIVHSTNGKFLSRYNKHAYNKGANNLFLWQNPFLSPFYHSLNKPSPFSIFPSLIRKCPFPNFETKLLSLVLVELQPCNPWSANFSLI